jgi:hypothetical protein
MAKKILFLSDFIGGYASNLFRSMALDKLASYWKNRTMKLNFTDAVKEYIGKAVAAGQPFSIYDITKALRQAVNDGKLDFSDRVPERVGGKQNTFRVEHEDVRTEFLMFWQHGEIDATRSNNGSYNLYIPDTSVKAAPTLPPAGPHYVTGSCPPSYAPSTKAVPAKVNVQKLRDYLSNSLARGFHEVDMKRIQSRFPEVTGVTCEQYADIIEGLGFTIDNSVANPSQWLVIL